MLHSAVIAQPPIAVKDALGADLFVQYGQDAAIERMMYEKAQQEGYSSTAEWLKNH